MATIYNSELTKELVTGGRIQQSFDTVPSQLAEKVVPVMEVNPRLLKVCNVVVVNECINSTGVTIYTTPTDKDFYLVGVTISLMKDATSTSIKTGLGLTLPDGSTINNVCGINGLTLTAQSETISSNFPYPILLKRGSNITLNNSTNVANVSSRASIFGYTVDNINA